MRDESDTKAAVKFSQGNFSVSVKKPTPETFGERLLKAYGVTKKGELAARIGVEPSSVTLYMRAGTKEGSYPAVDRLIKISEETNCDLHWLLTGKGEEGRKNLNFLHENERQIILTIAGEERKSAEDVVCELILEALAARAAELFTHLNRNGRITESERLQLVVLYDLVSVKSKVA